jgi:hypothetical protein
MDPVPAACMKCGAIFWIRLPFSGSARVLLRGNMTNCPIRGCGGMARVAEGLFEFTGHGVAILSAPEITFEMLIALRALAQSAHKERWPIERFRQETEAISPAFGGLFKPSTWSPEVKSACIQHFDKIIIALMAAYILLQHKDIDAEAILDAIVGIPEELFESGDADAIISERIKQNNRALPPIPKPKPILGPPKPNPKRKRRSKPKRQRKRKR